MTEAPDDHDVFAAEASDRCKFAHPIVYCSRVAYRFGVEDVYVEGWDGVCHVASEVG